GLRQRVGADRVRRHLWQVALLDLVAAPAQEGVDHERVLHVDQHANRRIDARDRFHREHRMKEAGAAAAVALGDLDAHDAEIEQLADERRRQLGLLVHFAHQRPNLPVGELVHAVAEQPFVFGQGRQRLRRDLGMLRRHGLSPARCYHRQPQRLQAPQKRLRLGMASRMRTVTTAGAALLLVLGISGHDPQAQAQGQSQPQRGQAPPQPAAQQPAGQQPPAQQPAADAQQPPPPPTFRTGINFVRVDVIISDNKGNAVADLTQNDFEVAEDGKPQKIETFKFVKLDGGVSESIKEAPRPIRNDYDEEMEASRDDVRLFAIFLDDYHVRRGASLSVRNPLSTFIETNLGPSDMIGVMYPLESTASVRMTRNHSAVMRGLQQFRGRKYDYEPRNQYEETYAHYPAEIVEKIRNQVSLSALKA